VYENKLCEKKFPQSYKKSDILGVENKRKMFKLEKIGKERTNNIKKEEVKRRKMET
jgi:hypothetical protein